VAVVLRAVIEQRSRLASADLNSVMLEKFPCALKGHGWRIRQRRPPRSHDGCPQSVLRRAYVRS
jgi:hypothetical protein